MRDALAIAGVSAPDPGKFIRCPLHSENSASFHLLGEPGRESGYKCFGCDAKGGVADFLVRMKLARDEADAARLLETKFGPDDQARVTASFVYTFDGKPVARVDRKEPGRNGKAKDFLPYAASGQTFAEKPGLNGTKLPLYRREDVLNSARSGGTVVLVEGEGKGDVLRERFREAGKPIAVTTISGGANAALLPSHLSDFSGARRIYVLADSDSPGRECAKKRAAQIAHAHSGAAVYTVDLFPDKSDGSDVADWLRNGGTLADLASAFVAASRVQTSASSSVDGVLSFSELLRRGTEHVDWFIEGLLRDSGMMLLASKPKVGKSTLARNIARCVASGEPFLGRRVKSGKVLWIGLEEPLSHLLDQVEVMAMQDLPIEWVIERPQGDENEWLENAISMHRPKLVIIDTIGRFSNVDDINHYSQVTRATQPMLTMRSKYGCAFILLHHNNHSDKTLGSVMWEGVVDTVVSMTRNPDGQRYLKTIQRSGVEMAETALHMDENTLAMTSEDRTMVEQRIAEQRILQILSTQGAAHTREYLAAHCGRKAYTGRYAVDALASAGLIVSDGTGKRGEAKVYTLSVDGPPINTPGRSDLYIYVEDSELPEETSFHRDAKNPGVIPNNPDLPADSERPEVPERPEETADGDLPDAFRSLPDRETTRIMGGRMCSICRRVGVCIQRDQQAVCRDCLKVEVAS